MFCRLVKQTVSSGVTVLGGVTLKVHSPMVIHAMCIRASGLDLVSNSVPTLYRVEMHGDVYYSKSYQRVTKRNSYTVFYLVNGRTKYGFINYFVYILTSPSGKCIEQTLICDLTSLSRISKTSNHLPRLLRSLGKR